MKPPPAVLVLLTFAWPSAWTQQTMPGMQMSPSSPGMQMQSDSNLMLQMHPHNFIEQIEHHASSGTSAEPNSTSSPMLMEMSDARKSPWMLMFHANAFVLDQQQSSRRTSYGERGGDKLFSTNWFMPMAEREVGATGQLTLRAMFSLEPATITDRRYPLLFQQGETAFGKPIVDGQHPHNFFMEIAALYDLRLTERTLLSFYAAPVGDPSIGPTAYPHRASAMEDPVGALGHHQQDSTHIAYDVVTAGIAHDFAGMGLRGVGMRIEASGFHGREPDESRWTITVAPVDSWSTRLTVQPGENWSGQYSYARIASPEALFPGEDQARTTASIMYNRSFTGGSWASTVLWGRTRDIPDNAKLNSYLFESTVNFSSNNHAWTRIEDAGRTNELLNGENPLPTGFVEQPIGHVQAYTFGYDRDVHLLPRVSSAFGAQVTTYGVPDVLRPLYGSDPIGVAVFLRLRPVSRDTQ